MCLQKEFIKSDCSLFSSLRGRYRWITGIDWVIADSIVQVCNTFICHSCCLVLHELHVWFCEDHRVS